ncbi:GNAT family N-acetyltransferase [Epibacterium ulvae]|uniref:GNAT family N-acetyltransferase n=1 Tax=Epibacterium ulvae TaxID=1156985 RepID=UPI001BFC06DF|nr:GNAT family protein [Epibacterium ulvae]MBT8152753.1 GNAT family N-acetyltransferase [Epibacterium ulvae]
MIPVLDSPRPVVRFVEFGLWQGAKTFGPATGIGFATPEAGLVAGVVYHNFDPDEGRIELSGYAERADWLSRSNLREIFHYPFEQVGVRIVIARHSERNVRAVRLWDRLGAVQHHVPEIRARGEAEIIAVLDREAWQNSKFFGEKNG